MKQLHNSRGFTLIELIMVIVILGILAAVAIPRFINLQTDAQRAAENGTAAGVRAGISVTHAAFLLNNAGALPAVDADGNGWPDILDNSAVGTAGQVGLFSYVIESGTAQSDNWSKTAITAGVTISYKGPWGNSTGAPASTWTFNITDPDGNGPLTAGTFNCTGAACP